MQPRERREEVWKATPRSPAGEPGDWKHEGRGRLEKDDRQVQVHMGLRYFFQ